MINVTGTLINLYQVCKRETWLHANGIRMEHTSDVVTEGKLVHETSYPNRAARYEEVRIGGSVIDFYDPKEKVIHEIKKSTSKEEAYIWQVKYYLLMFEREGIADVVGMLGIPFTEGDDAGGVGRGGPGNIASDGGGDPTADRGGGMSACFIQRKMRSLFIL